MHAMSERKGFDLMLLAAIVGLKWTQIMLLYKSINCCPGRLQSLKEAEYLTIWINPTSNGLFFA